ncbi:MAG: MFS transporter [Rhodospirillales bacterium]|nr:MFS transporter [Rhodospirillales bacterium]
MVGVFGFPALLPTFLSEWRLSNTEAGWIAGIFFGAYALSVPILVSLSDRIDARRVYVGGALLAAGSSAAFTVLATGFWSALILRALAGVALAATYMPGLRVLVDRYNGPRKSRAVALYTASFSLGTAVSFLLTGEIAAVARWPWAFAASAAAAFIAATIVLLLNSAPPQRAESPTRLLDFRPVLANRAAMGFVLGYAVHCWELFAFRSWLVALLAFSLALKPDVDAGVFTPTTVAVLSALVAMLASVGGNELCVRHGRKRVIQGIMAVSAAMAFGLGFASAFPYAAVVAITLVYSAAVQLDSAALTAGAVLVSEPGRQGATMAVHALIGFGGGFVGPLVLGWVLDISGGGLSALSWGLAFASVGVVGLLGPLAMRLVAQDRQES